MSDKKILVVDDDPDINYVLPKFLKRNGFPNTTGVQTVKEALEFIEKEKPDLILLDIQLNDLIDGIEILRRTKATLSPNSLVVMITGHKEKHKDECMAIGSHSVLGKPMGPEEITVHVKTIYPA